MDPVALNDALGKAGGGRVEKPWGYEIRFAVTDRYLGKIIHIDKGHALSLQYHQAKEETIYILEGQLDLILEDGNGDLQTHHLKPGESAHITPPLRHRFVAATDVKLCEVSTPEIDDVVRLEDNYGREGTNAP